jgi:hypothetical protein
LPRRLEPIRKAFSRAGDGLMSLGAGDAPIHEDEESDSKFNLNVLLIVSENNDPADSTGKVY